MARHFLNPAPGSPQQTLLAAVDARYTPREAFFEDVAERLHLKRETASKAFYGFLDPGDSGRPLPTHHRAIYIELLDIDSSIIDAIAAERLSTLRPLQLSPLAGLEAQVETQGQEMTKALRAVTRRLQKVEEALARLEPPQEQQAPRARNKK